MKLVQLAVVATLVLAAVAPAASAQEAKFINLALWDPIQIFNNETAIHGFRLNIYGNNTELKGLDIGVVNRITGNTTGLQFGIVNWTEGDFTGWQNAPVQKVDGFMLGLQIGQLFTMNGSGKGLQVSALTMSEDFIGLQVGIVNYSVKIHGLQIGLINIIKEGGMLPFFPIFNFGKSGS